jgi:beta-N-acetylhexosaminidase
LKHVIAVFALAASLSAGAQQKFELSQFFHYVPEVEARVDSIYQSLSNQQRAAQLIMPAAGKYGQSDEHIEMLVKNGQCGGILLLNGSKEDFKARVQKYNSLSKANGHLPLIYSADAEPSLINYKITGTTKVTKASEHKTRAEVRQTARVIAKELKEIGIQLDFAPVIDISTANEAIGNRSFGNNPDSVIAWSNVFINELQNNGIAATVKHFPGHGVVKGDTHKQLVYIDGEMTEVPNYKPVIDQGAIAVMVGHIAVRNNKEYDTGGLPSTVSGAIVTNLLRNTLGFHGLVVTDAMNMGGVKEIEDRMVMAVDAGCDILLMPKNEDDTIARIVKRMESDEQFRQKVEMSVRRILRLKVVLGLI